MGDKDQKELELLQEAFADVDPIQNRKRKFRWNNVDDSAFTQDLFKSDDEDDDVNTNNGDVNIDLTNDDESKWRKMRLERDEYLNSLPDDFTFEDDDSQVLRMGKTAVENSSSRSGFVQSINSIGESNSGSRSSSLSRTNSNSQSAKVFPQRSSFLGRNPELLAKYARFKELNPMKKAVKTNNMVFKTVSSTNTNKKPLSRPSATTLQPKPKKLKVENDDSNSIFNLIDLT